MLHALCHFFFFSKGIQCSMPFATFFLFSKDIQCSRPCATSFSMVLSAFQAVWHLSLGSNNVRIYASCYTVALVGLHHSPALILLSVKCEHPSFLVVDDTIMMLLFLFLSSLLILSVFGEGMSAVGRPRSWAALPSRAFKYCPARGCPVRRFKQCCFDPTCYHPHYCSFMKPMKQWVMVF